MSLEAIKTFGFADKIEAEKNDQSPRGRASAAQAGLQKIVQDFLQAKEGIYVDVALTHAGKLAKMKELGEAMLAKVESLKGLTLLVVERSHQKIESEYRLAVQKSLDATGENELLIERRHYLSTLDESARLMALDNAVAERDILTLQAVVNAPEYFGLVLPAHRGRLRDELIAIRSPRKSQEYQDSKTVYEILSRNFEEVSTGISAEAQVSDTVASVRE